ncbi:MAG: hypothetical protein Q6J74_05790, partial [Gloeomargarita sp. DG02_1_bins_92]
GRRAAAPVLGSPVYLFTNQVILLYQGQAVAGAQAGLGDCEKKSQPLDKLQKAVYDFRSCRYSPAYLLGLG